ncbi:MAG: SufE family protein [Rhizobiales bacterium]|nr:SufE family protein [Hyphomicrobiales bacterium]
MTLDDILDNFEFLDDWEDKYRYVIELGRQMPPFADDKRTAESKVEGCVSQVWLVKKIDLLNGKPVLTYQGDSDAHIVKGLVALVLSALSGRSASDILNFDMQALFDRIGLREHLTPQRSNGLNAMVNRIKNDARAALEAA